VGKGPLTGWRASPSLKRKVQPIQHSVTTLHLFDSVIKLHIFDEELMYFLEFRMTATRIGVMHTFFVSVYVVCVSPHDPIFDH